MPCGYGIRVTTPDTVRPTKRKSRIGYASGCAQDAWLLAANSVKECIDSFEKCLAVGALKSHDQDNDIFFINEVTDIHLMRMCWLDDNSKPRWCRDFNQDKLYAVSNSNSYSEMLSILGSRDHLPPKQKRTSSATYHKNL